MATYKINDNGEREYFARFERSGVLYLKYIFPDDRNTTGKLLKTKNGGNLRDLYTSHTRSVLVRKIFYTFIMKVLKRVASGDLFLFPGTTGAHIVLKKTPDKEVKMLRQLGKFMDIDIVKAKFNIPRFTFDFGPKYTRKDRQIYVPKWLQQLAVKNVENGTIPWTLIRKRLGNADTVR